jgi:hypothetical protein
MAFRTTIGMNPGAAPDQRKLDCHVLQASLHLARRLHRRVTAPRRLSREQRIAAEEQEWLRLSAMSDAQVVGLDGEDSPKPPMR